MRTEPIEYTQPLRRRRRKGRRRKRRKLDKDGNPIPKKKRKGRKKGSRRASRKVSTRKQKKNRTADSSVTRIRNTHRNGRSVKDFIAQDDDD